VALTPNPPTPRGKVIQTNGVNLYYEVHGQGMPLLLLHAGSLCDSWQPYRLLPSTTVCSLRTAAVTAGPIRQRRR
jgi:hypothetical protein